MIGLLAIQFVATWFMVGLIWTIQIVHYPLFPFVGEASFPRYEEEHTRRMGWLLAIPAPVEVATAAALVFVRPSDVSLVLVLAAGAVLAVLWVTTALVHVPLHRELADDPSTRAMRRLVATNWVRTIGWTGRGGLVILMVMQVR
jgi:hypothetical protein